MKRKNVTASPSFLAALSGITCACSLFDLWYTLRALATVETAREVNPVFALLLRSPALAVAYKLLAVPLLLALLWYLRERRSARLAIYLCTAVYVGNTVAQLLTMYHWWGI